MIVCIRRLLHALLKLAAISKVEAQPLPGYFTFQSNLIIMKRSTTLTGCDPQYVTSILLCMLLIVGATEELDCCSHQEGHR